MKLLIIMCVTVIGHNTIFLADIWEKVLVQRSRISAIYMTKNIYMSVKTQVVYSILIKSGYKTLWGPGQHR